MTRPLVLVTNDDGIESFFLEVLVHALATRFDVRVVAPLREQSWTGRSFTRRGPVAVARFDGLGVPAWSVDGTPSDCANIGLDPELVPGGRRPEAVVSGINLGFNVTLPLVLSSGTVAAATEGALAGLPALAFSQRIPADRFEAVREAGGRDAAMEPSIRASAKRAVELTEAVLDRGRPKQPIVHNINFPAGVTPETPVEATRLGIVGLGHVFSPDEKGVHRFGFPRGLTRVELPQDSDRMCIRRGHISHTVLDYAMLGARLSTD